MTTRVPEAIQELMTRPRWVCWRYVERDGKVTKPPFNAETGTLAESNDASTWRPYGVAANAAPDFDGVGFLPAGEYTGIDLDHCLDPGTLTLTPWAQAVVDALRSYTEITPSGQGVRVWLRGTLPPGGRVKRGLGSDGTGAIECYDSGRYFTVTGAHLAGTPTTIEARPAELARLHADLFPDRAPPMNGGPPVVPVDLDDAALLARARAATNGEKFAALWAGDHSGYPSQSEADQGLANLLAFWTGRDLARMDRLFRQSGLFRPKWDARHFSDGRTYGAATLARAVDGVRDVYAPPAAEPPPRDADTRPLGIGLGDFLARDFPPTAPLIEGVLFSDGGGWLGGEEKLMKTLYAEAESLGLALGRPVCGRFQVPARQRVLFIEEEDSPRRTHTRFRALLRGQALDPDAPPVQADLNAWFRLEVWSGFTLDEPAWVARLAATLEAFRPAVCYLDVLRKLTRRDLNKASEAGLLLAELDALRRRYGVLFRVVHHYRKVQGGYRVGRGSQELGGSFQLGAWAENSLFFEPIGRKQGAVKVEVQTKDGPPVPAFTLRVEAEGPAHAPTRLVLHAEAVTDRSAAEQLQDQILQVLGALPTVEPLIGMPGVPVKAILHAVKRSDRPVRTALRTLVDTKHVAVVGQAGKRADLYALAGPG